MKAKERIRNCHRVEETAIKCNARSWGWVLEHKRDIQRKTDEIFKRSVI